MIVVPLLAAPALLAAATAVERRLGSSAAGWTAALPVALAVAVAALAADAGGVPAGALALGAAAHVPAQVLFGLGFAAALVRRGLLAGVAAGAGAYAAGALLAVLVPTAAAVAAAVLLVAVAPRLAARVVPPALLRPAGRRGWVTTALTCVAAAVVVGLALGTARLAGPDAAGAAAAFPTMCLTLTVVVTRRDGVPAGAYALVGLLRSVPCYLSFAVVAGLAAPAAGLAAVPLGLAACAAAALATWRGVPVSRPAGPAAVRMAD